MTNTPRTECFEAWWEEEEAIEACRAVNLTPQIVWSQHNWDYWCKGGRATNLQVQDWQEKGLSGAYFPDNELWRSVWKWLMSLPIGRPTLEFTHPNGAPWTSPLVLADSTSPPRRPVDSTSPPRKKFKLTFREKPRDKQLEGEERHTAIRPTIQGFTSQSGQLRVEEQTLVSANDAEGMHIFAKMPLKKTSALSEPIIQVYPQRSFRKDATYRLDSPHRSTMTKMPLMKSSALSEPIIQVYSERSFEKDAITRLVIYSCHSSQLSRASQQSSGKQTQTWWSLAGVKSIPTTKIERRQCSKSEK